MMVPGPAALRLFAAHYSRPSDAQNSHRRPVSAIVAARTNVARRASVAAHLALRKCLSADAVILETQGFQRRTLVDVA
jgi:hypothetical protein